MTDNKLQVIPLGGLGEFGIHCLALRYRDQILVIDAGMMFPDEELLGVDIVIPDFTFLVENQEAICGLVLTHAHEDHIGAVPFLLSQVNVPVYGTPFTLALLEKRLEEHQIPHRVELHDVVDGQRIQLGPFDIHFIHVTHSTVDCVALAIRTPIGVVVHSGDFKIDPTPLDEKRFDYQAFAEYGKEGVLLLLADSTNAERPGWTESERAVRPRLEEVFHRAIGRVIVTCFSSSIYRIQQVIEVSHEVGRKVAILGRSMLTSTELAHDLGYLEIPDRMLLRPQEIMEMPAHKVTVLAGGSQAEPMSTLSRIALGKHRHLIVEPGDVVVFSARMIPGNEQAIFRMMNHFAKSGAELVYGSMHPPVHVSGHASSDELRTLLHLTRPKFFVPVHGEYRQLARNAAIAAEFRQYGLQQSIILETGEVLEVDADSARKVGRVPVGRVCIDSGVTDEVVEALVIHDRRHLAEEGFVIPIVAINKHTGTIETEPEIVTRGFVSPLDGSQLVQRAREIVTQTVLNSSIEERTDWGVMKEKIRAALRKFLVKETARQPLIVPVILEV